MPRNRNSRFSGSSGQSIRESIQNRQRAFSGGGRIGSSSPATGTRPVSSPSMGARVGPTAGRSAARAAAGGALRGGLRGLVGGPKGALAGIAVGAGTAAIAANAGNRRSNQQPSSTQASSSSTPRQQSSRPRTNAGERQASQRRTETNQEASQPSSFGQAFSQARAAGKSQFEWQGQQYHTRTREETQRMESRANFGRGMTRASTPTDPTPEGRQAARRNAIMERRGTAAEPRRRRTTHPGSKPINLNPNAR